MEDLKLDAIDATPESFAEFGQVIEASPDDQKFGPHDAQLDLSQGIPRFYIMRLKRNSLKFSKISHHASVTQCLGSVHGRVWYLGVAKSSIISADEKNTVDKNVSRSRSGHFYIPPDVTGVRTFRISGPKYIMLNKGTWHEGPLFTDDTMDFYNLELSNTYVADQTTHNFGEDNGFTKMVKNDNRECESRLLFSPSPVVSEATPTSGGRTCGHKRNSLTSVLEIGYPLEKVKKRVLFINLINQITTNLVGVITAVGSTRATGTWSTPITFQLVNNILESPKTNPINYLSYPMQHQSLVLMEVMKRQVYVLPFQESGKSRDMAGIRSGRSVGCHVEAQLGLLK
ncbi:hypothetical protein V2J09_002456 [Rumex salicifolius]